MSSRFFESMADWLDRPFRVRIFIPKIIDMTHETGYGRLNSEMR